MSAYRFPVYLLGLPGAPTSRLDAIASWCVIRAGADEIATNATNAKTIFEKSVADRRSIEGASSWDSRGEQQRLARAITVGQGLLNVSGGTVQAYRARWDEAENWISQKRLKCGPPSFVSVGHGLLWEEINSARGTACGGLGWRHFSILCGVNCAIGDKRFPFVVTRDFIRAACVGLKSGAGIFQADGTPTPAGMEAIKGSGEGVEFPTVQQTRDSLALLEERALIGRVAVSRRATAYFRPGDCPRDRALEWLKTNTVNRIALSERRQEEREILARTKKNHSHHSTTRSRPLDNRERNH